MCKNTEVSNKYVYICWCMLMNGEFNLNVGTKTGERDGISTINMNLILATLR